MSDITCATQSAIQRKRSLQLLAVYAVAAGASALIRVMGGTASPLSLAGYAGVAAAAIFTGRSEWPAAKVAGDWLPLLALPVLYAGVSSSIVYADGRVFDAVIQACDRAMFGSDPARVMAGAMPWRPLSELLHLAYFSYYLVIYGPALALYFQRGHRGFHDLVSAFTITMVSAFLVFSFIPVEGPRYAWPEPPGVPAGPVRALVLSVLQAGSTRGTAFPSSHVAIAVAISIAVFRWSRIGGASLLVTTVLLGWGAVYGGFHYATDVMAGMALGSGCWGISRLPQWRSFKAGRASAQGLP